MTNEFKHLLRDGNEEKIKDYIFEKELEYYGNCKMNSTTLLSFSEEESNKIMHILGIDDNKEPIYSEFSHDKNLKNSISIYKTNVYNLFLVKKPQLRKLIFTNDITKLIKNRKEKAIWLYR